MFVGTIATVQEVRSYRLRRVFNFQKELRRMRKSNKKPKYIKQIQPPEGTFIGFNGRRGIYIPDNAKHIFVCGTTGSGKTVLLSNFIKNVIVNDVPCLILDGKGDMGAGSLLDIVLRLNQGKKKVYVINLSEPEQSDKYNPFLGASSAMATDMLINMTDWSEPHYKLNAERYIQRILQMLELAKIPLSFNKIITCMKSTKFTDMSNYLMKKELISKEEHLDNLELLKTSGKIAQSSVARFSTIAEGQAGKILSDDGINIAQALKENAIILFVLNPMLHPELSPAFGRLALIDSKIAIGELYRNRIPRTFFIMDEISSYATTAMTDLVNKSRSANVTCVLATQSHFYHPDDIKVLQTGQGIFLSRDTNTHCRVNVYKPF